MEENKAQALKELTAYSAKEGLAMVALRTGEAQDAVNYIAHLEQSAAAGAARQGGNTSNEDVSPAAAPAAGQAGLAKLTRYEFSEEGMFMNNVSGDWIEYGEVKNLLATLAAPVAADTEQATDERAAFEAWIKSRVGHPFAGTFVNLMWDAWQARAALGAPTGKVKETPESMANSNTRFAIDGAILFGRQGANKPPSEDHWLYEYWMIGQQLAKLGETSAWDNATPLATPADAGAGETEAEMMCSRLRAMGLVTCDAAADLIAKLSTPGEQALDQRAVGRAEAVQIILGMSAEEGLGEYTGSHPCGTEGEWDAHWEEDKLRELFRVDDASWSFVQAAVERADALEWEKAGNEMEAAFFGGQPTPGAQVKEPCVNCTCADGEDCPSGAPVTASDQSSTHLIEAGALRQYQHNDGSDLVFAYDKAIVDREFARLAKPPVINVAHSHTNSDGALVIHSMQVNSVMAHPHGSYTAFIDLPGQSPAPVTATDLLNELHRLFRTREWTDREGDWDDALVAVCEEIAKRIQVARGAVSAAPVTAEPAAQTALAQRLLDMADKTDGRYGAVSVLKADLIAICCEANRYYSGMLNWKRSAEAKDRELAATPAPADRDALAQAIHAAAAKRGIIDADTAVSGPQLVMLCADLAEKADRDAIRNEALEEAAKACEGVQDKCQRRDGGKWPELRDDAESGAGQCAEAVRALKSMERAADAAETRDAKGGEHG